MFWWAKGFARLWQAWGEPRPAFNSRNRGDWEMGFKPWGNLSVLLLAGAALVGCNNTPQKDKSLGAGPKIGDASIAKGQTNMPGPKFPSNTNGPSQAYPQAGANPNPLADISPKSPWPPTPGSSPAPLNSSFAPAGGPLSRDPFPPLPKDI